MGSPFHGSATGDVLTTRKARKWSGGKRRDLVRDGGTGEEVLRWSGEREEVGVEERTECGPLAFYEAARRPLAEASRERLRLMGVEPIPPQADPPSAESGGDALTLLPLPLVVPAAAQSGRRFAAEGTYSSREEARAREREWGWGRRGSHAAAAVAAASKLSTQGSGGWEEDGRSRERNPVCLPVRPMLFATCFGPFPGSRERDGLVCDCTPSPCRRAASSTHSNENKEVRGAGTCGCDAASI